MLQNLQRSLGVILLIAVGTAQGFQPPVERDRKLLQGRWDVVAIVSKAGKEEPKPGKMLCIIVGDKIFNRDGAMFLGEAKFTLDSSKTPRTIDLRGLTGDDKGKIYLGIYELTGPDLKLCVGPPSGPRPTGFVPLPNQSLIILKRFK